MSTFVNLRGTNGSGKSTLARSYFDSVRVPLISHFDAKGREREISGNVSPCGKIVVVGDYSTTAGGLDKIKTFELQQRAVEAALWKYRIVIAEGVLASTVFGSWGVFARNLHTSASGHKTIWAYFETPLAECLRRIQQRNGGKPIKENLVQDKIGAIWATRRKAEITASSYIETLTLPYLKEKETLDALIARELARV